MATNCPASGFNRRTQLWFRDAWVEVWLGALLGGFQLEQRGEFYEPPVWVKYSDDQAMTLKRNGWLEAGKLGLAE